MGLRDGGQAKEDKRPQELEKEQGLARTSRSKRPHPPLDLSPVRCSGTSDLQNYEMLSLWSCTFWVCGRLWPLSVLGTCTRTLL